MTRKPELVLASASPRRRVLLAEAGLCFRVAPAELEERALPGEPPADQVARFAREKALTVARRLRGAGDIVVLGADTLVVLGGRVLGKPRDAREAETHLASLCGHTHRVMTAVAVVPGDSLAPREVRVESEVVLRAAGAAEIRDYVATGEPLDKAGAYAVQGEGRRFVERVIGSESNVIGLPMQETLALLHACGVRVRSAS
jgi:septum formation protein